jgi:hypothetical protein
MTDAFVTPAAIKTIYDLLEKLITGQGERRKALFKEVINPLFDQLLTVHDDYHQMFLKSSRAIPYRVGINWEIPGKTPFIGSNSDAEVQERIFQIKRDFSEWRKVREAIRDKVRVDAADFLKAVKGKEEQRFLFSIVLYFLEDNRSQNNDSSIDQRIASVLAQSGTTALDTPSSRVDLAIWNEQDVDKLKEVFEGARRDLNERFTYSCRRFNEVRIAIHGLTTRSIRAS